MANIDKLFPLVTRKIYSIYGIGQTQILPEHTLVLQAVYNLTIATYKCQQKKTHTDRKYGGVGGVNYVFFHESSSHDNQKLLTLDLMGVDSLSLDLFNITLPYPLLGDMWSISPILISISLLTALLGVVSFMSLQSPIHCLDMTEAKLPMQLSDLQHRIFHIKYILYH